MDEEIQKAVSLYNGITDEVSWQEFDRACAEADFSLNKALIDAPPENEEKLRSDLEQIRWLRMEGFINWQMEWREAEAIANPKGFYGQMRARRLEMEEVLRRAEHAHHN